VVFQRANIVALIALHILDFIMNLFDVHFQVVLERASIFALIYIALHIPDFVVDLFGVHF